MFFDGKLGLQKGDDEIMNLWAAFTLLMKM